MSKAYTKASIQPDWKSKTLAEMISFVKKSKFKTAGQWKAESGGSYAVAWKKGWLKAIYEACGIAIQPGWESMTLAEMIAFVKKSKLKTAGQWEDESGGSYNAARKKGWLKDIYEACGIAGKPGWESMTLAEMITFVKKSKFKTAGQWVAESGGSYAVASKKGRLKAIYEACGVVIQPDWKSMTLAETITFVKKSKFKTPGQWIAESGGSYAVARKKGWLKAIYMACDIAGRTPMKPRNLKGLSTPGHCLLCGKPLKSEKIVWLSLDTRTDTYTDEEIPPYFDQGGFEFGPDCAKRMRAEHHLRQPIS